MSIELRQRTPLGAFYRSPLGAFGPGIVEPPPNQLAGTGRCISVGASQTNTITVDAATCTFTTASGFLTFSRFELDGVNNVAELDPRIILGVRITGDISGGVLEPATWGATYAPNQCFYQGFPNDRLQQYSSDIVGGQRQYQAFTEPDSVGGPPATEGLSYRIFINDVPNFPPGAPGHPAFTPGETVTVTPL